MQKVPAGGRVDQGYRVLNPFQGQALDDAGQAKAVIAVKVGEAYDADIPGLDPVQGHLPLSALAGIKEQTLLVPTQEKTNMISK
jgi:hypothetical protein